MRKWTIIDTLIVAAVVVVAVVGVKILGGKASDTKKTTAQVVVLADDKNIGFSEAVKIDEWAAISLSEQDGGIVKDVKFQPSKLTALDSINGVYNNVEIPDKEDVYIYMDVECTQNERAITVGETVIKVGENISVRGKGYATEGHIVEINIGGEE